VVVGRIVPQSRIGLMKCGQASTSILTMELRTGCSRKFGQGSWLVAAA